MACRICYEPDSVKSNPLLKNVCECTGSAQYIHKECLEKWIKISQRPDCEICHGHWKKTVGWECRPIFIIFLGSLVSAIHALVLHSHVDKNHNSVMSIVFLSIFVNATLFCMWMLLGFWAAKRCGITIWSVLFFTLSVILQWPSGLIVCLPNYLFTLSIHVALFMKFERKDTL